MPYKNTYVKEPLVTENEYRVAKPETIVPKSFEEARQILPNPIWGGHDKELEMYWKAWEIDHLTQGIKFGPVLTGS